MLLSRIADPDSTAVFWARYENAQGKLWETRNPADRSSRLDIKRVRALRLHEWWEERQRSKAMKRGAENEQAAVAGLQAEQPQDTPGAQVATPKPQRRPNPQLPPP